MTSNQIAYQANLERERTNRANEAISSRQAGASEAQARVAERKARITELEYDLKRAKNAAEINKIKTEIKRLEHQNKTDTANAVTSGIGNVGKGIAGFASALNPLSAAAKVVGAVGSTFRS